MTKYLKFGIFLALAVAFTSCKQDDLYYEGEPYLFFKSDEGVAFVEQGSNHKDVTIDFGAMKPVDGSHPVNLVVDTQNSTAVEGTQFQILNNGAGFGNGANSGKFTIRILESGSSTTSKAAVFKLQSNSIANAQYNQTYTLNMSLTCPISNFLGSAGNFNYTTGFWQNPDVFTIEEVAGQPNTLRINDFLDIPTATPLIVKYDANGVVTFDTQDTGFVHSSYGMVKIRMSTDPSKVSTIDKCSRKLVIYANYFVPQGQFTDDSGNPHIKEEFVGF
ncbi:hypothetical protein D1632_03605 [Chryseobacterium nematophagum]|uniref:DUF4843 domain-containing protein n=1 Tax=Chryseobacterium nematophagum TaxID=2305228 RepID=A0A3M7LHJ0_9FLAO|nr:hypothetical protein [Chryseobacterium nematophagum]RMZ61066.1 hypothetical protein D1632_03605 [Chryseobacterium nematophagum]